MSKLETWTPLMAEFKAWLAENYDEVFGGECSK
jgi:hypothetical protein